MLLLLFSFGVELKEHEQAVWILTDASGSYQFWFFVSDFFHSPWCILINVQLYTFVACAET